MEIEISKADEIIEKHGPGRRGLIPSLLEIQDVYHYLPPEALATCGRAPGRANYPGAPGG